VAYSVIYSRAPLPIEPLSPHSAPSGGPVRQAGPFHDQPSAFKEACRIRRELLGYEVEIWRDDKRIMNDASIRQLCK
jgi:hypothetical protein